QKRDVLADLGGLADDDAHAVVDEETGTELRRRMDLDAREKPRHVRQEACRNLPAAPPHGMAEPVKRQRGQTRAAEQDVEGPGGGRMWRCRSANISRAAPGTGRLATRWPRRPPRACDRPGGR